MYKNQLQILQMPERHTFELLLGLDITIVTLTSTRCRNEKVFATDWDKTFDYHKYQIHSKTFETFLSFGTIKTFF